MTCWARPSNYFWTQTVSFTPGERIKIPQLLLPGDARSTESRNVLLMYSLTMEWRSVLGQRCQISLLRLWQLSSLESRVQSRIESESCRPTSLSNTNPPHRSPIYMPTRNQRATWRDQNLSPSRDLSKDHEQQNPDLPNTSKHLPQQTSS